MSTSKEKRITMQDVRDYLTTLGPDQIAGVVSEADQCPVARAGEMKYGLRFIVTEHYAYPADLTTGGFVPDPEIAQLVRDIDSLRLSGPVSRSEVEGVLPIKEDQQ